MSKAIFMHIMPDCPFCERTYFLLRALGYDVKLRIWHFHEFKKYKEEVNPITGLFPMVEFDGKNLTDSTIIMDYFLAKHPTNSLTSLTPKQKEEEAILIKEIGQVGVHLLAMSIKNPRVLSKTFSTIMGKNKPNILISLQARSLWKPKLQKIILSMENGELVNQMSLEQVQLSFDKLLEDLQGMIISKGENNPFLLGYLSMADFIMAGHLMCIYKTANEEYERLISPFPQLKQYQQLFLDNNEILQKAIIPDSKLAA